MAKIADFECVWSEKRSRCLNCRFFSMDLDSTGPIRPPEVYYEIFNRPKHWVPIVDRRENGQLDNGQLGIWGRPVTRLLLYLVIICSKSIQRCKVYWKDRRWRIYLSWFFEQIFIEQDQFIKILPGLFFYRTESILLFVDEEYYQLSLNLVCGSLNVHHLWKKRNWVRRCDFRKFLENFPTRGPKSKIGFLGEIGLKKSKFGEKTGFLKKSNFQVFWSQTDFWAFSYHWPL